MNDHGPRILTHNAFIGDALKELALFRFRLTKLNIGWI
jgi:hypothetical protein